VLALNYSNIKKAAPFKAAFSSGELGIRTPGTFRFNGFQDRRIRPLCQLSGAKIGLQSISAKSILKKYSFSFLL
jgi:hypothetical protein